MSREDPAPPLDANEATQGPTPNKDEPFSPGPVEQRAQGAFLHDASRKRIEIQEVAQDVEHQGAAPDVYEICELLVPRPRLIPLSTPPNLEGLMGLQRAIGMVLGTEGLHPTFVASLQHALALLQEQMEVLALTHVDTTLVPPDSVVGFLKDMEARSQKSNGFHEQLAALQPQGAAEINVRQQRLLEGYPKVDTSVKGELTEDTPLTEGDGIRVGWKGAWWRHNRRQACDEALDVKAKAWKKAEDRDDEADEQVESIHLNFVNAQQRLALLADMLGETSPNSMLLATHQMQHEEHEHHGRTLQHLWQQQTDIKRSGDCDLDTVETKRADVLAQDRAAAIAFRQSVLESDALLERNGRRMNETQSTLEQTHSVYHQECGKITEELPEISETAVVRLQREIEDLQRDIARKQRQIAGIELRLRLDREYREAVNRLQALLAQLRAERDTEERARAAKDEAELHRCMEVQRLLQQLQFHQELLQNSVNTFGALIQYINQLRAALQEFCKALSRFQGELTARYSGERLQAHIDSLEAAAPLCQLLEMVAHDKQVRIESMQKSTVGHTLMLEFCVDTADPDAHKHSSVLEELQDMEEDLTTNISEHRTLIRQLQIRGAPSVGFLETSGSEKALTVLDRLTTSGRVFFSGIDPDMKTKGDVVLCGSDVRSLRTLPVQRPTTSTLQTSTPSATAASIANTTTSLDPLSLTDPLLLAGDQPLDGSSGQKSPSLHSSTWAIASTSGGTAPPHAGVSRYVTSKKLLTAAITHQQQRPSSAPPEGRRLLGTGPTSGISSATHTPTKAGRASALATLPERPLEVSDIGMGSLGASSLNLSQTSQGASPSVLSMSGIRTPLAAGRVSPPRRRVNKESLRAKTSTFKGADFQFNRPMV